MNPKHRVFISYHHTNDQAYKEALLKMNEAHDIFIDYSVDTGDIPDNLPDEQIRQIIRDEYLRDSTVTILLVGTETKRRKHIDWELYSSMYDGRISKKSGIFVINLPSTNCIYFTAQHSGEKEVVYPENREWIKITSRIEYESRYPYLPDRIIDNLLNESARISVTNWERIFNKPSILSFLINETFNDRVNCEYDLSRQMRRNNS